jgi:hypothetical protein
MATWLAQEWSALDEQQRAAWTQWANDHPTQSWTGTPKRITGQNLFVACNLRRLLTCGAITYDAPTHELEIPNPVVTAGADPSIITFWWDVIPDVPPYLFWMDVWLTKPLSPGRKPTIHLADRKFAIPYHYETSTIEDLAAGRYGLYTRLIDDQGLATTFRLVDITVPG